MHVKQFVCPALVAVALTSVGCARVSDTPVTTTSVPAAQTAAQVVTAAFGDQVLAGAPVPAGRSAMATLRATTPVTTAYGGGFVNGMYGKESTGSPRQDWMYFVNGVAPDIGAADYTVRAGDRIWWDYRRWGQGPAAQAVVGSWPEPFVHGYPTAPTGVQADPPLDAPLRAAGATLTTAASRYRVIVGANQELIRRDATWRHAVADPDPAGLTVQIDGTRITRLAPDGEHRVAVPGARAIVAAVLSGAGAQSGGVVLAVAGVDDAAAQAAARAIATTPGLLSGHYALVFDGAGHVIASAGRTGP